MNYNIQIFKIKIMKNNYVKGGLLALMLVAGTAIQAQETGGAIGRQADAALGDESTSVALTPDTTNPNTVAGTAGATVQGGAIRVIDNKGTKKYLQVQNGITQVTDTALMAELLRLGNWEVNSFQIPILISMRMNFHLTMYFKQQITLLLQLHSLQAQEVLDGLC